MAQLTLSSTAQEIVGSSSGCLIQCPDFMFGFGATTPATFAQYSSTEPLDYGGAYGSIWVKALPDNIGDSTILTYFVAV